MRLPSSNARLRAFSLSNCEGSRTTWMGLVELLLVG